MEFRKTANYNIRFVDIIDSNPYTVDLTPAEVYESSGTVIYVLRVILTDAESGSFRGNFGVCLGYNLDDMDITFIVANNGDPELMTLHSNDFYNDYFHLGD